jgi:hypothetical protein
MKKFLFAIAGFVLIVISSSSCKKETTATVTSLTKTQILVQQSPWEIQELDLDSTGSITQYIRGGISTTADNYSVVRFTFNADGTGSYTDVLGVTSTLNWLFTTQDQSNIQFNINSSPVYNPTWSLVGISDSSIVQTNYQSSLVIESAKLVPVQ